MTKKQALKKYGEEQVTTILEMAEQGYGSSGITFDGPRRPDGERFTVRQVDAIVNACSAGRIEEPEEEDGPAPR